MKHFNSIQVQVRRILRATGLENKTPGTILNKVMGTDLLAFAKQGILING